MNHEKGKLEKIYEKKKTLLRVVWKVINSAIFICLLAYLLIPSFLNRRNLLTEKQKSANTANKIRKEISSRLGVVREIFKDDVVYLYDIKGYGYREYDDLKNCFFGVEKDQKNFVKGLVFKEYQYTPLLSLLYELELYEESTRKAIISEAIKAYDQFPSVLDSNTLFFQAPYKANRVIVKLNNRFQKYGESSNEEFTGEGLFLKPEYKDMFETFLTKLEQVTTNT